jgi:hypothetical protein
MLRKKERIGTLRIGVAASHNLSLTNCPSDLGCLFLRELDIGRAKVLFEIFDLLRTAQRSLAAHHTSNNMGVQIGPLTPGSERCHHLVQAAKRASIDLGCSL